MLMRKAAALYILICLLSSSLAFAQTNRGVGVRVKGANGQTTEVKLYNASYALVIGNINYQNWDVLNGVKSDVTAVQKTLSENGFRVETALDLDSQSLSQRIEKFVQDYGYEENNRLMIYFAGHGFTQKSLSAGDDREIGFIVPIDAPLPSDKVGFLRKAVNLEEIRTFAKKIQAKHALFVFDSCFSGKLVSRGEIAVPAIIQESVAFPVRQFITAGSANQTVPDESVFRRAFTRGIEGDADLNQDGYVLASELASYLRDKVTNLSNRRQTPLYAKIDDISLDRGDFVFVVGKTISSPTAPNETQVFAKDRATVEREAWTYIKDSSDPQDFRSFLSDFPNGANAGNAKIKLEQAVWDAVKNSGDKGKLQGYLNEFPSGVNAPLAKIRIRQLDAASTGAAPNNSNSASGAITAGTVITNSLGIRFAYIPAGTFQMGSNQFKAEKPVRTVSIGRGFYMGRTEVTQGQWEQLMGTTIRQQRDKHYPSVHLFGEGADYPMYYVSWEEAKEYIRRLNARNDGYIYSLPTEAEWEYAARAGTTGDYGGNGSLDAMGWYDQNSGYTAHPVGQKSPNAFGLYDMHGNVWEWCEDIYNDKGYAGSPTDGSANVRVGDLSTRVLRGGSWGSVANGARSASRLWVAPSDSFANNGFRVLARLR